VFWRAMFASAAKIEDVLGAGVATGIFDDCKPRGSTGGLPGGV